MNQSSDPNSDHIDQMLRDLGPALPEPRASDQLTGAVNSILRAHDPLRAYNDLSSRAHSHTRPALYIFAAAALIALALLPAILLMRDNLSLRADVRRLQHELASADPLANIDPDTLLVVNFHHDMCPRAAQVTPKFKQICEAYGDRPVAFITLNVTGQNMLLAAQTAKDLQIPELLSSDPGLQTGFIKVVDPAAHKILAVSGADGDTSPITEMLSHLEPRNGS